MESAAYQMASLANLGSCLRQRRERSLPQVWGVGYPAITYSRTPKFKKRHTLITILSYSCILLSTTRVYAAELYASPTGATTQSCTYLDQCNIEHAIAVAESNKQDNTIYLASGKYNISHTLRYYSLDGFKLKIEHLTAGPAILDGGGKVRILDIHASSDVSIANITFENGSNDGPYFGGGALRITVPNKSVELTNLLFNKNRSAVHNGGALYVSADNITITANIFYDNYTTAQYTMGGGLAAYAKKYIRVSGSYFRNNNGIDGGGGLYISTDDGAIILTNSTFANNIAKDGAGLRIDTINTGTITFTNNTVVDNTAESHGGGVSVYLVGDATEARIYNNIIWDNKTKSCVTKCGHDLFVNADGNGNSIASDIKLFNNDLGKNANVAAGNGGGSGNL